MGALNEYFRLLPSTVRSIDPLLSVCASGQDIDYDGAAGSLDFDAAGDVAGVIGEYGIEGDTFKEMGIIDIN